MKKRLLPALLALVMVVTLLPLAVFAEGGDAGDGQSAPLAGNVVANIEAISTGGTVTTTTEGQKTISKVTFGPEAQLFYAGADSSAGTGRNEGYHVGVRVTEPAGKTDSVKYRKVAQWWLDDGKKQIVDSAGTDNTPYWTEVTYTEAQKGDKQGEITLWGLDNIGYSGKYGDTATGTLYYRYQFDWNGDGTWDQEVIVEVLKTAKLIKDGNQMWPAPDIVGMEYLWDGANGTTNVTGANKGTDWREQTFYFVTDRAMAAGQFLWADVTIGNVTWGIRCRGNGSATTFAFSPLTEAQWDDKPTDSKLTVPESGGTAEIKIYYITAEAGSSPVAADFRKTIAIKTETVTIPAKPVEPAAKPELTGFDTAPLGDTREGALKITELYTANSYKVTATKNTDTTKAVDYTIAVEAKGLKAHQNNANPKSMGYWVGVKFPAAEGYTIVGYQRDNEAKVEIKDTDLESDKSLNAYYRLGDGAGDRPVVVTYQKDGKTVDMKFIVNLSNVEKYVAPEQPEAVTPDATTGIGSTTADKDAAVAVISGAQSDKTKVETGETPVTTPVISTEIKAESGQESALKGGTATVSKDIVTAITDAAAETDANKKVEVNYEVKVAGIGSVELTPAALGAVKAALGADNTEANITVKTADEDKTVDEDNAKLPEGVAPVKTFEATVEVVKSGNKTEVTNWTGATGGITLTFDVGKNCVNPKLYLVTDDAITEVASSYSNATGLITATVDHLSVYMAGDTAADAATIKAAEFTWKMSSDFKTAAATNGAVKTDDWQDQTMYVAFNETLANKVNVWFDVKIGSDTWGCAATGDGNHKVYAFSFKNMAQWEQKPANATADGLKSSAKGNVTVTVYDTGATALTAAPTATQLASFKPIGTKTVTIPEKPNENADLKVENVTSTYQNYAKVQISGMKDDGKVYMIRLAESLTKDTNSVILIVDKTMIKDGKYSFYCKIGQKMTIDEFTSEAALNGTYNSSTGRWDSSSVSALDHTAAKK